MDFPQRPTSELGRMEINGTPCLSLTAQLFGATHGDRRRRKGHVSGIDLMYFCAEGLAGTQWLEKVDPGRKLNPSDKSLRAAE